MNIKHCFQTNSQTNAASAGLLLVRLVVGCAFILHGWGKIQNPMEWMGPEAPVPGILQMLAAISEFGGGIALILGLLMPLAMFGLAITMAVATFMHAVMMKDPFVPTGPGQTSYELALVFFTIMVMFMTVGPGKFSLDAKIFGVKN